MKSVPSNFHKVMHQTISNLKKTNSFKITLGVFNGLGDIDGPPINIKLKPETTTYHITTPRHILFEAVKEEIKQMEKLGVIKQVEHPTD